MVLKNIDGNCLKVLGLCAMDQEKYKGLERAQDIGFPEWEI